MIKVTLKLKDMQFRKNYLKTENTYKLLKAVQNNQTLPFKIRFLASLKISKFRNSSKSKMVNRCIITNRGRAVYRPFNLSRHELKRLATNGEIFGVKKSSW